MNLTIKQSFDSYAYKDVTEEEYFRILRAFMQKVPRYLIDEGKPINLLSRLGTVQIGKYKPGKRRPVDWVSTNKYGKRIFHENMQSDGFSACFRWFKRWQANFKHKKLWSLNLTRENIRPNNGRVLPGCLSETIKREGIRKYRTL